MPRRSRDVSRQPSTRLVFFCGFGKSGGWSMLWDVGCWMMCQAADLFVYSPPLYFCRYFLLLFTIVDTYNHITHSEQHALLLILTLPIPSHWRRQGKQTCRPRRTRTAICYSPTSSTRARHALPMRLPWRERRMSAGASSTPCSSRAGRRREAGRRFSIGTVRHCVLRGC